MTHGQGAGAARGQQPMSKQEREYQQYLASLPKCYMCGRFLNPNVRPGSPGRHVTYDRVWGQLESCDECYQRLRAYTAF